MNTDHLKKQAAERLGQEHEADPIIHDLRVHQIELEIQNEELRGAYDRLERTTREYTNLFEKAPMGLVVIDEYGIIRRCNAVFQQLLGSEQIILNHALAEFVTPESARAWRGRFRAFFSHPEEKQIDLEILTNRRNRQILRFVGRSVDLRLSGTGSKSELEDASSLMLVAIDVTAEIEAGEQTQDLLSQKELLLRELRHRTQNHFQTVQSMLSFLASRSDSLEVAAALDGACQRIHAMSTVNESLTVTSRNNGVDIAVVLGDLVESISDAYAGASDIRLVSHLESVWTPTGSASVVGLIAHELVNNAYKYAFTGYEDGSVGAGGVIELSLRSLTESRARLEIRDNGNGFSRVAGDRSPSSSGLGLALVEGLAGQVKGEIDIDTSGAGTVCTVDFEIIW